MKLCILKTKIKDLKKLGIQIWDAAWKQISSRENKKLCKHGVDIGRKVRRKENKLLKKNIVLGTKLETSGKTQQLSDVHSQCLSLASSTI